jgi:hypothetical protein
MSVNSGMNAAIGLQLAYDAYPGNPSSVGQRASAPSASTVSGFTLIAWYGYASSNDPPNAYLADFLKSNGAFAIYVNNATHQLVFSFKGSTLNSKLSDWGSDVFHNGDSVIDPVVNYANTIGPASLS